MPNYNYTHGGTTNFNRVRLLIGDHRGTNGTSATGWLFSDEEIGDIIILCATPGNSNLWQVVQVCLFIRMSREAMNAGVAGTTDTTDRPAAIKYALESIPSPAILSAGGIFSSKKIRTNEALKDEENIAF